jgi:hypothetical protein
MGGGRIFLKTFRASLFNEDLSKSLILAGSISLDSTFKLQYYRCSFFAAGGAAGDGEGAGVEQPGPALQARVPVRLLEIVLSLRMSTRLQFS